MARLMQTLCLLIVILTFTDQIKATRLSYKLKNALDLCGDKRICEYKTEDRKWCDIKCISHSEVCNGKIDCPYGEDEKNCPCDEHKIRCIKKGTENEMICATLCDGYDPECKDDKDESDEKCPCPKTFHRCMLKGYGISGCARPCNGNEECIDGSDEKNCLQTCDDKRKIICQGSGKCAVACDDCIECHYGEDELYCEGFDKLRVLNHHNISMCCPENKGKTLLCFPPIVDRRVIVQNLPIMATAGDGINECQDGRDEFPGNRFCECETERILGRRCCIPPTIPKPTFPAPPILTAAPLPCVCKKSQICTPPNV